MVRSSLNYLYFLFCSASCGFPLAAVRALSWSLTWCPPGGIFFPQDSFTLQHCAAVCEWLYLIVVLLFYATFALEFRSVSAHTLVVLIQRGQWQGVSQSVCKQENQFSLDRFVQQKTKVDKWPTPAQICGASAEDLGSWWIAIFISRKSSESSTVS